MEFQVATRVQPYLEVCSAMERSWVKGRPVDGWGWSGQASRFPWAQPGPPGSAACVFYLSQFQNCRGYQPWVLRVLLWGIESGIPSQLHSVQPDSKLCARLLGCEDRPFMMPPDGLERGMGTIGTF